MLSCADQNEAGVGRGLRASGLKREEVFLTTKLAPSIRGESSVPDPSSFKTTRMTIESCEASVGRLGTYADLYLIHTPFSGRERRLEQWRACVECQQRGLVRSIGVSNFGVSHLKEIEASGLPLPAANQLELHPLAQKPRLLSYMRDKGIAPIAYSSLAPLSTWRRDYATFTGSKGAKDRATPPLVQGIAARLGVSEARVLLRYGLQKGWAVLPKSTREERMRENLDLDSFVLSDADIATLDAMEQDTPLAFGSDGRPFDPTSVA